MIAFSILGRIIRIEDDGTNPRRTIGSRRSIPVPSEPLSASAAGHIGTPPKAEETQERRE